MGLTQKRPIGIAHLVGSNHLHQAPIITTQYDLHGLAAHDLADDTVVRARAFAQIHGLGGQLHLQASLGIFRQCPLMDRCRSLRGGRPCTSTWSTNAARAACAAMAAATAIGAGGAICRTCTSASVIVAHVLRPMGQDQQQQGNQKGGDLEHFWSVFHGV